MMYCEVTEDFFTVDSNNEARLVKRRKSLEEAARVKETCPFFFDEALIVADQLSSSKDEISALKSENASLLKQILSLNQTKAHFEKERSTLFRDASALYKHGIVELQLSVFMNEHENDFDTFKCGVEIHKKTFTEAMHHWCSCPLNRDLCILNNYKEDRVNLRLYADEDAVKNSLYFLYDTLSGLIHFKAGEEYPIRIVPFANSADTLALMTFLKHYDIPMVVTPTHPVPPLEEGK
jgi:hypothetical protein